MICVLVTAAAALSLSALQGNTCFNCRLCAWLPATVSQLCVCVCNTQESTQQTYVLMHKPEHMHAHDVAFGDCPFQFANTCRNAQACIKSSCQLSVRVCVQCVSNTLAGCPWRLPVAKTLDRTLAKPPAHTYTHTHTQALHWSLLSASLFSTEEVKLTIRNCNLNLLPRSSCYAAVVGICWPSVVFSWPLSLFFCS